MLIGMNLTAGPVRRIKAPALERNQNRLFFALENLDRYSAGCSMNPAAGGIPAPNQSSTRDVAQIDERFTFEETFPDKTHSIFDHRLIFRVPRPCSVRQKAPVVGVL